MSAARVRYLRCQHIALGTLPRHSTIAWETGPDETNPTDYSWSERIALCTFCSG